MADITEEILDHYGYTIGTVTLPEGTPEDQIEVATTAYEPLDPATFITRVQDDAISFGRKVTTTIAVDKKLSGTTQNQLADLGIQMKDVTHHTLTGNLFAALRELKTLDFSEGCIFTQDDAIMYGNMVRSFLRLSPSIDLDGLDSF